MTTTSWTTVASSTQIEVGGTNWTNASAAAANDGNFASCSFAGGGTVTDQLAGYKDFQSIVPTGSLITQVDLRGSLYIGSAGTVTDNDVRLLVGGSANGSNKKISGNYPTSEAYRTWTSWTGSLQWTEIGSGFGLYLSCINNTSFFRTVYVDVLEMRLTYTAPTTSTLTPDLDAAIQKAMQILVSMDASITIDSTRYVDMDAVVKKTVELNPSLNAQVVKRSVVSLGMDACIGYTGGWLRVDKPTDTGWSKV